LSSMWIL